MLGAIPASLDGLRYPVEISMYGLFYALVFVVLFSCSIVLESESSYVQGV